MRKENYTEEEIEEKIKAIKQKNDDLMQKTIARFKLDEGKKPMSKCFDHWVMWLKHRKLMRDKLKYCNNSVNPDVCDL